MYGARIRDENRPCLQWVTGTTLIVTAHLPDSMDNPTLRGDQGLLTIMLRDGRRYTSDGLVVDFTVIGEGGCDTALPAANGFWYVYLVPSALNPMVLAVIASTNAPPTGPTGYGQWVYAGSCRWDNGAGAVDSFRYLGHGRFNYTYPIAGINEGAADDAAAVAVNLAAAATDALPAACYSADIMSACVMTLGGGSGIRLHLWAALDAGITAPTWAALCVQEIRDDGEQHCNHLTIPSPPTLFEPYLFYQREDLTAGSTAALIIGVTGYIDAYLY